MTPQEELDHYREIGTRLIRALVAQSTAQTWADGVLVCGKVGDVWRSARAPDPVGGGHNWLDLRDRLTLLWAEDYAREVWAPGDVELRVGANKLWWALVREAGKPTHSTGAVKTKAAAVVETILAKLGERKPKTQTASGVSISLDIGHAHDDTGQHVVMQLVTLGDEGWSFEDNETESGRTITLWTGERQTVPIPVPEDAADFPLESARALRRAIALLPHGWSVSVNRPVRTTDTDITCKGSYALGTACGNCARCDEDRRQRYGV